MRFAVMALGAVAALAPSPALAFECTVTNANKFVSIRWQRMPVPYAIREPGPTTIASADGLEAVQTSFAAWDDKRCTHLDFRYDGVVAATTELREVNQVIFVNEQDEWQRDPEAVGLTTMTYSTIDGTISHGKIELNEHYFEFVDASVECESGGTSRTYDLESVVTHEVGHFVGLAHVPFDPDIGAMGQDAPTMIPSVPPCDMELRTLETDDLEGLCFIYPSGSRARGCDSLPAQAASYVANQPFACASVFPEVVTVGDSGRSWPGHVVVWLAGIAVLAARLRSRACSRNRSGG